LFLNKEIYFLAYNNLKNNNFLKNIENINYFSINDILNDYTLDILLKSIRDESFQFHSSCLFLFENKNYDFKDNYYIIIDLIVQEAIRIILEAVFIPIFFNYSIYNIEKINIINNVIYYIKDNFRFNQWIIKCHIKNNLNDIKYKVIINILNERITDNKFINLIYKYLNSNYNCFEFKSISYYLIEEPINNLSSLLLNIVFNKFDNFILKLKKEFKLNYNKKNKIFLKLNYVRYFYEFFIGFSGSYIDALLLSKKLEDFILKNFELNVKFDIFNFKNSTVKFLGFILTLGYYNKNKINNDILNNKVLFFAPISDIKNKLIYYKLLCPNNKILPKFS